MSRVLPYNAKKWEIPAILDGRKTVTRRLVKPQPVLNEGFWTIGGAAWSDGVKRLHAVIGHSLYNRQPYQPGDILYVRETWSHDVGGCYIHRASYKEDFTENTDIDAVGNKIKWHPSIHMPKEAARIWLKVTDVRVERLQDITEDGAVAEGIYKSNCRNCNAPFGCDACPDEGYDELDAFVELWDSTIKKSDLDRYGWDANPYVWVVEFECCEKPEQWKGEKDGKRII